LSVDPRLAIRPRRHADRQHAAAPTLPAVEFTAYDNIVAVVPDLTPIDLNTLDRSVKDKKETSHA